MKDRLKIILMHVDGISNRQIAAQLGIDKNTVNTRVNEYDKAFEQMFKNDPTLTPDQIMAAIIEPPRYDSSNRGPKPEHVAAIDLIRYCLEQNAVKRQKGRHKQQMKMTDIHRHLLDNGFEISYSTVKRYVNQMEKPHTEAYIRQTYEPGIVCEFDWGEVKLDIPDGTGESYQMAVFTSAYSNYRYARLFYSQDTAAFQEAHALFFDHCGGVFHQMVYDNMKVAVKKFVGHSEKEPTEALMQLSGYYRFKFRFCNVRRGNEKGHVEKSVETVRRRAFSIPDKDSFDSLAEANKWLEKKCREMNAEEVGGRIPEEFFRNETTKLMSVPPIMACYTKKVDLRVTKYSVVTVNTVRYSVPEQYVGRKLTGRVYTDRVEIYDGPEMVATHQRSFDNGSYHLNINHFLETFKRKPGALAHSTALVQTDARIRKIYENYYTTDPREFLDVLETIRDVGIDHVEKALETLSVISSRDFNAQKVRLICDNHSSEKLNNKPGTDRLSEKSKDTLINYDRLRELQSRKAV